ncbi:hypothetical protein AB0H17_20295 [Streptomyces olivoreticuli]
MAGKVDRTAELRQLWPDILGAVKQRRRFTWILMAQNARVVSWDGVTVVLSFANQGALDNFVSSGSGEVLRDALDALLGTRPVLQQFVEGQSSSVAPPGNPGIPVPEPLASLPAQVPARHAEEDKLMLVLAQTAHLLHEQGSNQAAALLLDVEGIELVPGNRFGDWQNAVLIVPSYLVSRFTEEAINVIQPVFGHVASRHEVEIGGVSAAPALPHVGENWRQALQHRLAQGTASNQAARTRSKNTGTVLSKDGFVFDSREEMRVYDALKRSQTALPSDSSVSIFPLPMGRVATGGVWTPDFLVAVAGRVGIIEVDGPHHKGRLAADATRDRHWRNSGVVHIERILVEETSVDSEIDGLVGSFLKRLREYR